VSPPIHQEVAFERCDGDFFSGELGRTEDLRVVVTRHALNRALERFHGLERGAMADEVASALAAGRARRRRPRWLRSSRIPVRSDTRFVWPPGRGRCYVVRLAGDLAVVITVLPRDRAALEAA
jgi:hypothetical protein